MQDPLVQGLGILTHVNIRTLNCLKVLTELARVLRVRIGTVFAQKNLADLGLDSVCTNDGVGLCCGTIVEVQGVATRRVGNEAFYSLVHMEGTFWHKVDHILIL
jgi:hypothetical protein